jgi:hypothetical protein
MQKTEYYIVQKEDWKCDAHSKLLGVTAQCSVIGAVDRTYRKIERGDEIIFMVYGGQKDVRNLIIKTSQIRTTVS